ncbi:polyribonucleotide nucleotidyltransferase [Candidatus Wolfebacteria bacterium]|nr:polyribonucleotide nucleotidyltransferase [Candidatus Wolfebacteria bacterium]
MDLQRQEFTTTVRGKPVKLEVSRIAEQATSAVLGTFGDTTVLVTATIGKEDRNLDYFPLVIDYEEKFYAAGKIIGSRFIRREGRPSEEAVLSGRLIDRTLRPLFNHALRRDVQIVITVIAYDEESEPDFIALLAASTALAISPIPWNGPVAGVKIARLVNGQTLINPGVSELKNTKERHFEAFVAGTEDKINMIELAGCDAKEDDIADSFTQALQEIKSLVEFERGIVKYIGKPKLEIVPKRDDSFEISKVKTKDFLAGKLKSALFLSDKGERQTQLHDVKEALKKYLQDEGAAPGDLPKIERVIDEEIDHIVHKNILESNRRVDGRALDEVRDLHAEIKLFNRLHGSALFIRGNTQALGVVTLAPPGSEQLIETMEISAKRRFMLHYNFPPYSTGEVGRLGGPGRREIGHGALAEKSIRPLIPSREEFPYTIRIVSEILSSNGSSSMATVCASSLALMDAGVPIKKHVAGIAMGLMIDQSADAKAFSDRQPQYKVLTDIQGPEDHHGDMDCKVAGTKDGVNGIQMDVKIDGITTQMMGDVLRQAKEARLHILKHMEGVIAAPRTELSPYAPIIMMTMIRPDQIGGVIGPGGKVINGIIAATGALSIDVEQNGQVCVSANDPAKARAAIAQIEAITREFKVGDVIEGPIIKIMDFGAIVDLGGGQDGMIHISELKQGYVQKVEDMVKLGDVVKAKVIRAEDGRIGLSLKALQDNPEHGRRDAREVRDQQKSPDKPSDRKPDEIDELLKKL